MNSQLTKRFEDYFPSMDSEVKEEEILLFLDKSYQNKFDRKIFNEIKHQITSTQNKPLTPRNFSKTYFIAYKQLRTSEEQARREIESLRQMRKITSGDENRSRVQNFSGYGIADSEANQKISGGVFDGQNSIGNSNGDVHEIQSGQLMMVEFDPINLDEFSSEFLNDHSIQTVFGINYNKQF